MGLFQGKQKADKKPPIDETSDGVQRFFDGYFHDLRIRSRVYFEEVIDERVDEFKKDLDATVSEANAELKKHIVNRLEEQFTENSQIIREAQKAALQSLTSSAKTLEDRQRLLGMTLEKSIAGQETVLGSMFDESKAQVAAIKATQDATLESLTSSAKALEDQQRQLSATLEESVEREKTTLVTAFEENMAQVVERYLVSALGEQYDLKAQLPAIIQQMEANKQAIVDDMKL